MGPKEDSSDVQVLVFLQFTCGLVTVRRASLQNFDATYKYMVCKVSGDVISQRASFQKTLESSLEVTAVKSDDLQRRTLSLLLQRHIQGWQVVLRLALTVCYYLDLAVGFCRHQA